MGSMQRELDLIQQQREQLSEQEQAALKAIENYHHKAMNTMQTVRTLDSVIENLQEQVKRLQSQRDVNLWSMRVTSDAITGKLREHPKLMKVARIDNDVIGDIVEMGARAKLN
jgi:chromosome segregation ATPase